VNPVRYDELEELCSLYFHSREVNNRFKKLGLNAGLTGWTESFGEII
jgi:hypothetical protein